MSRVSRVPYHQNVYDLLQVETRVLPETLASIRDWEERTGNCFPPSMAEWYASEGELRCGEGARELWKLPLVDLWSEFSNDEQAHSLTELLGSHNRPEHQWREPLRYDGTQYPGTFFRVIAENQGNFVLFAYADGSDDPPVFTTHAENGPWLGTSRTGLDILSDANRPRGWQPVGNFREVLFLWLSSYYPEEFVPLSFNGNRADREDAAPPKPYLNGVWLRTPSVPFHPPVIDFLIERFGEPEVTPRPGNVRTYDWRPTGGTIRITADEPTLAGGLSAWWVHAETPERLAEFARLLLPWGTLRDTLRADTEPARDVLKRARGA
jgi:hypothetical protein